jgi:hypothetical protein
MATLLKGIFRFYVIPIKIPMLFFTEVEKKSMLKFIWKHKRPQVAKEILNKKTNAGGIRVFDSKLCYNAIVTKTWYWHTHTKDLDQWN